MKNFIVVVKTTPDNKIGKYLDFDTQEEADAHLAKVLPKFPQAFVVEQIENVGFTHTTVDAVAKTITYDSVGHLAVQVMDEWKGTIHETDSNMPRYAEDILDSMADKSGVAQITLDRLQEKKTLRETKP
jgi:hypothetical protein